MFVGTVDDLGDKIDAEWARDQITAGGSGALKFFKEYKAGHSTFMIGKDTSYEDDLVKLLNQYNNHWSLDI